jgi:PUA-domain protein
MEITSRHHLRSDAITDIQERIADRLGVEIEGDAFERLETDDRDLVLVDGEPLVFEPDGEPFLTVRGANAFPPTRRVVTVDAGAVSFVSDGADVMRPGIVEADEAIASGDLVVIQEESHGKSLAVGRARVAGADMVGDEGKVVDSIHHVGDELFDVQP